MQLELRETSSSREHGQGLAAGSAGRDADEDASAAEDGGQGGTPVRGVAGSLNPIVVDTAESPSAAAPAAALPAAAAAAAAAPAASERSRVTFDPALGDATPEADERDSLFGGGGHRRGPRLGVMGPSLSEQLKLEGEPLITPKSYMDVRAPTRYDLTRRLFLRVVWLPDLIF